MLEIEKTYLAKYLPKDLEKCESKELIDIYLPVEREHPSLRLRKSGDRYEMTKKTLVDEDDASRQIEETIILDADEFAALSAAIGKKIHKIRYYYPYQGLTAEVDVFQDELSGLVVIDFEFSSPEEQDLFQMPDFCLREVTQETFIAGGMLCGKSYGDIKKELDSLRYNPL